MTAKVIIGILIPFIGTLMGAACVFFVRNKIEERLETALLGFAAGVMLAACVWSLIMPAMEMGRMTIVAAGFALGIIFLLAMNRPHFGKASANKRAIFVLAVILHNIPEGMAVGIIFAGVMNAENKISMAGAMATALGVAIQNFPEGAIISMPMRAEGKSRLSSFLYGAASGIVELVGAVATVALSSAILPALPYLLSFAAGAMAYVAVSELIPEAVGKSYSDIGTIGFAVGFMLMMILNTAV